MIPPNEWPIGSQYATVTTVSHKSPLGVPDPSITDRMCLASEAGLLIQQTMSRNPYATSYVSQTKVWRGAYSER